MLYTIEQHIEGLKNMRTYLVDLRRAQACAQQNVVDLEQRIALAEQQLARAKRLGKTRFDPERFCVPRGIVGIMAG
jgi:hypothetical protein